MNWKLCLSELVILSGINYFVRINTLSGKFRHRCILFHFGQGRDWYRPLHVAYFSFGWISMHHLLADEIFSKFWEAPFLDLFWMTVDQSPSQYWKCVLDQAFIGLIIGVQDVSLWKRDWVKAKCNSPSRSLTCHCEFCITYA